MTHNNSTAQSSVTERDFLDYMQHGDDLMKVELLRNARIWYQQALELNMETGMVKQKIAECDRLLAYERKIVWILLGIASALILAYLIFFK
jgi:hypothetical protein